MLKDAGQVQLGRQLLKTQLLPSGRIARSPESDPIRKLTFIPGRLDAATGRYVRKATSGHRCCSKSATALTQISHGLFILRRSGREQFISIVIHRNLFNVQCDQFFEQIAFYTRMRV